MTIKNKTYCLDANVLIQAWQSYYAPQICPSYWDIINELGIQNKIFMPKNVFEEIARTEDDLSKWLKNSQIPIRKIDEQVTKCLQEIYASDPSHRFLVYNLKGRSLADPWVIAHAMKEKATVVTKENKVLSQKPNKIKIPNVCEKMNVPCINDFQLIEELGIRFNCEIEVK